MTIFAGRALWHVSIAKWDIARRLIVPVSGWRGRWRVQAQSWANRLLAGVGDADERNLEWGPDCLHWRRPCTPGEQANLLERGA